MLNDVFSLASSFSITLVIFYNVDNFFHLGRVTSSSVAVCSPIFYYFSFLTGKASLDYGSMVGSFVSVTIQGKVGR